MNKHLSISIVSWNTKDLLRQCLQSTFANLDGLDAEVIVVDNASQDGSADMVAREFPEVTLIRCGTNHGFAKANNIAYEHSGGKYFLLLNSDTIVLPGALITLAKYLDDSPRVGAVAPKLLNADGTLQRSCSCYPSPVTEALDAVFLSKLFPRSKIFGRYSMSYWDFDEIREVDFAGGSCLMLRREALEQVGVLDESYFMYTEEADLCYRLRNAGWSIVYLPHAQIVHLGGQSAKKIAGKMAVELPKSRHRFILKFQGPAKAAMFKGAVAVGGLCRMAIWGPLWITANGQRPELKTKLKVQRDLVKWALGGGRK
ncbi:MAG: glycosyltransferase family 2 protein [Armatimonadota bacterium]|nr:glycosyltransferase family 2 protein [Armatimonadota bacterium]